MRIPPDNYMTLATNSNHKVSPLRAGTFNHGDAWNTYAIYSMSEIARVFRGSSIRKIVNRHFNWGSGGPGAVFNRRPCVRFVRNHRYMIVSQLGGLDI